MVVVQGQYCLWSSVRWVRFFFKQRTAYGLRISDWRSDVCSSDLGFGFQCFAQPRGAFDAAFGEQQVAAVACQDVEAVECLVQEESKPDALAASALPHPVHAVVPVAGADQRQAPPAEPVPRTLQPPTAVLVTRLPADPAPRRKGRA